MPIAKGSKSKLLWKEEATYNVAPGGAYKGLSFGTESLVETINKIMSDEIRSDRQVPSIRGGNIATGGSIKTDFAPARHLTWMKHLLASTITTQTLGHTSVSPAADVTVPVLAAATVARGDYRLVVFSTSARIYCCTLGGVVTSGDVSTSLISTSGTESLTNTTWEYLGTLTAIATDYFYRNTVTPGVDYPAAGLAFEAQVLGQTSPLIVGFYGTRLNTLGITIPQEGIVTCDWGLVGARSAKLAATDSSSIVTPVDDPFVGYEAFLSINGGQVGRPIREGSLNITNNVEENVYAWGSRFRRDVPGNRREVNGQFTAYFEDHTEYDIFKNETEISLNLSLCRQGQFTEFVVAEAKLTGTGTPQIGGSGVITTQFNWDAFVQSGTSDVVFKTTTLLNAAA